MVFKKKLIAAIAAISMIATSFVAMTTVSADAALPVVKAEIVNGEDTLNGTDLGLKFTFENLTQNCTGLLFHIEIPADLKNPKNKAMTSLTNVKNAIACDEDKDPNPFADGWNATIDGTDVFITWMTYDDLTYTNSDWFELDFKGVTDYSSLPAGSLKLTGVQVIYEDETAQRPEKGTLKVVDPTTKEPSVEPTTPEYVYNADKPADTKWGAATFVGDYSTADDKAIAVKAEVKPGQKVVDGALVDNTYTGLVWKAVKADGTAVGYEQDGLSITGNGTYVFGLAIDGVSEAEVQTNGFGIAVK